MPWRVLGRHALLAGVAAFVVTWAGYRFSVHRIDDLPWKIKYWLEILPDPSARSALERWLLHAWLPMPELFHGLRFLVAHDVAGHPAYLLGRVSNHGFWTFYPIALLVKTPLPTLVLLALCLPFVARPLRGRWWTLALGLTGLGILLVGLRSHVNLGIRHVFVILPLVIVAVARTVDERLAHWHGRRRTAAMLLVGGCLVTQSVIAVATRRTALGFFNLLAGDDPAQVLVDSDLDWGQDLYLLRAEARARGIDTLHIAYFGLARQCLHDMPRLESLVPGRSTTGWIAISENFYRNRGMFPLFRDPCDHRSIYSPGEVPLGSFAWLEKLTPVAIAGTSIRLYHVR